MSNFSNLAAAMSYLKAQTAQTDAQRASNLRKSAHLGTRKPGTGPRIAK